MGIKKLIKRMGRPLFSLKQDDDKIISQCVLIADNGRCRTEDLRIAVKKAQTYFPGSKISLLTSTLRSPFLQNEFPGLDLIIYSQGIKARSFQIALKLFFLRKRNFDFLFIFSLDLAPLIVLLCLFKSKIMLYNQWGQWCSLRLRKAQELSQLDSSRKRPKNIFREFLNCVVSFFVLFQPNDDQAFSHNVLIVDDCRLASQLIYSFRRVKEDLPFARISVLTASKLQIGAEELSTAQIIRPDKFWIKPLRLIRHMIKLRKNNYAYVILLSLDIVPIMTAALFMKSKVLLRNRWHQWWRIEPKPLRYYVLWIPKFIINFIINTAIFIYLSLNFFGLYFKRTFNSIRISILNGGD